MSRAYKIAVGVVALAVGAISLGLTVQAPAAREHRATLAAVDYWRARAHRVETQLAEARAGLHVAQVAARDARLSSRAKPSSVEAIRLASVTYKVPFELLWRRAACESGPGPRAATPPVAERHVNPSARNPVAEARSGEHAVGLYGFLPSTFASTPYASMAITSPYANALAAAWMEKSGRGGEWTCR